MGTPKHTYTDIGVTQTSYFSTTDKSSNKLQDIWLDIFNCLTLLRLIDSTGFTDDLRSTF